VRRVLYMATLVAIRHNPAIKAFYVHLTSKGKESKVAIVAWLRKLITILNLLIKKDQLWITKRAFRVVVKTLSMNSHRRGYPSQGCVPIEPCSV